MSYYANYKITDQKKPHKKTKHTHKKQNKKNTIIALPANTRSTIFDLGPYFCCLHVILKCSLFYFFKNKTVLLKYNIHTLKFIHLTVPFSDF